MAKKEMTAAERKAAVRKQRRNAARRTKNIKRLTAAQKNKAAHFRLMLLEHHNLRGKEKETFENFVNSMSLYQLTNLSRQYQTVLEVWYDSEGIGTSISQDLMRRIRNRATDMVDQITQGIMDNPEEATAMNEAINALNTQLAREQGTFDDTDFLTIEERRKVFEKATQLRRKKGGKSKKAIIKSIRIDDAYKPLS